MQILKKPKQIAHKNFAQNLLNRNPPPYFISLSGTDVGMKRAIMQAHVMSGGLGAVIVDRIALLATRSMSDRVFKMNCKFRTSMVALSHSRKTGSLRARRSQEAVALTNHFRTVATICTAHDKSWRCPCQWRRNDSLPLHLYFFLLLYWL